MKEPNAMRTSANLPAIFQLIIPLFLMLVNGPSYAEGVSRWHNPTSTVQKMFLKQNGSVTEVLKLFKDGTYDHLLYKYVKDERYGVSRDYCTVSRDTGTYSLKFKKLFLDPGVQSSGPNGSLNTFWISSNGSLFTTLIASITRRPESVFNETKDRKYKMPFYIDPNSGVIVDNPDAKDRVDLRELVSFLIKGAANDREKFLRIAQFVMNSMDYDYLKLVNRQPEEANYETEAILAGPYRFGVCADYSAITKELCDYAHLNCRFVTGAAKTNVANLNANTLSNHAWNILKTGNVQEIYDLTWEDNDRKGKWMNVRPSLMIYSHFPEDVNDQLLEKPLSLQEFNSSPIIEPAVANAGIGFSFPAQGKLFFKDSISLTFKGNLSAIESHLFDGELSKVVYVDEEMQKRSFKSIKTDEIKTVRNGNQTTLRLKTERQSSVLSLKVDGVAIDYLLINADNQTYLKSLQSQGDQRFKDSYLKAIVASIVLEDAVTLTRLTGKYKNVFIDKDGKIKAEPKSLKALGTWNGNMSTMQELHYIIKKDKQGVETIWISEAGPLTIKYKFDNGEYVFLSLEQGTGSN